MGAVLARVVVLVAGAAILVVETLTTRLVAPYVGLTLESTSAAIGVALLGIAAGASWGGRLADAHPPRLVITAGMAAGGVMVLAVRPLIRLLGPVLGAGPAATVILVAVSTLGAVVPLAIVAPAVVKARLADVATAGGVVGSLSATGTIGSLAGVFLTGFVLVALLPVAAILVLTAVACLVVAAATATLRARAVAVVAVVAAGMTTGLVAVPGPCQVDSAYYCASVVTDPERPGGRVLVLDDLRHSYVDLDDPQHLEFAYTQRMADAISTRYPGTEPLDAVFLGGGGLTVPRWLAATHPGSTSTVLEIDEGVVELGRRELEVDAIPDLQVRIGDARTALATVADDSADVVVGDAFGSRSVPWHLATAEFAADVERVLRPGGVFVLNVIDFDPLAFLRAELATVASVFPETGMAIAAAQRGRGNGGNAVVVASEQALDWDDYAQRLARRPDRADALDPEATRAFTEGAPVLTDDRAPVDQLLNPYNS